MCNMLNCLFYSIFFALFLNTSLGALRLSQVNRVFMSSYKGMFEASLITVDSDGEPVHPYFNQKILREYINGFMCENLNRYTTNYLLNVDFYLLDGSTECSETDYARNVKITLKADINFLYKYDKTQSYTVLERNTHE